MPCTAGLERRDYLDFLPKRPQGATKILGTPALAGTKTPAALKSHSKDATTACAETPVNCPHCGQKRLGRASVPTPAVYPAFFFVLEKAVKSVGNAVISTFPTHWSHGLQHLRHKRPTFAFVGESGHTLGFAQRIAHSGLHGETGAFPRSQQGFALPVKFLLIHHAFIYIHFPVLCEPSTSAKGENPAKLPP